MHIDCKTSNKIFIISLLSGTLNKKQIQTTESVNKMISKQAAGKMQRIGKLICLIQPQPGTVKPRAVHVQIHGPISLFTVRTTRPEKCDIFASINYYKIP